jgi:hypothetical protein
MGAAAPPSCRASSAVARLRRRAVACQAWSLSRVAEHRAPPLHQAVVRRGLSVVADSQDLGAGKSTLAYSLPKWLAAVAGVTEPEDDRAAGRGTRDTRR